MCKAPGVIGLGSLEPRPKSHVIFDFIQGVRYLKIP